MAVGSQDSSSAPMSSGHRFAIGANVAVAIVAAALLLVAVNWICSIKYVRRDLASFSHYGLTDRTRQILEGCPEEIQIAVLYTPDPEDEAQQGYIERLQDYCDELGRYAQAMDLTFVATDAQRERLVARISSTFGGEAEPHKAALDAFERLSGELQAELDQRLLEGGELMGGDAWLGDFPLFANIMSVFRSDRELLKKGGEEIDALTPVGGIPKYADATTRAKRALTEVKEHFEGIGTALTQLTTLADEVAKPDSVYIGRLRSVAADANAAVASLREIVGPVDSPLPDDAAAVLKAFADRGVEVGNELDRMVRGVDNFARAYPMVTQHTNWSAQVRTGPLVIRMSVSSVLLDAGKTLRRTRLLILGVIDTGHPDQLRQTLVNARQNVAALEQNASACEQLLTALADRLSSLDEGSKALLDAAREGRLLSDKLSSIDAQIKEIEDLPELKLGTVADQLKEDNTVVVEASGRIRVVGFSEVFPVRESVGGRGAGSEELGRTFNGDAAIPSAILALTRGHPFATVVLTSFEPPAPPQRGPFTPPPPRSRIPSRSLSEIRARLEGANFKVVDWNLATTKEAPEPEDGTENVYVMLPPTPPASPNPFGPQTPPAGAFGEEHRQIVRDLLDHDARMVFLASWEISGGGMFGGPLRAPPYGYGPLLEQDWGIRVRNGRRVIWIEPDRQKANTLMVVLPRFNHMPVGGFMEHPASAPMKGTRFLVVDACPIELKEELPEGVTVESMVRISSRENYIGVELSELVRIIDEIRNTRNQGKVTLVPFPARGPFDIMVAAERYQGGESKGKIAVVGFGASLNDEYLKNPVMADSQRLRLDPPPTENVDLFVNTLHWLQGQTQWIARGPVPVPRVEAIEPGELAGLRVFVWGIWPVVVFAPGVLLWWVRRR